MFCCGQRFCHNGQRRIPEIRFRNTQLFDAHPAIQASGAVNFDTVREKVNLNRCSLRMNAIVAVNNGIEDCFGEAIYGILRFIRAGAGFDADIG